MTIYDEEGRRRIRLDVFGDHPHGDLGENHVHIQQFNENGQSSFQGVFKLTIEELSDLMKKIIGG